MTTPSVSSFFGKPVSVINVGLSSMAQALRDQSIRVTDVDWRPAINGAPHLTFTRSGIDIDQANDETCRQIKSGRPMLVGMGIAGDHIPGMNSKMFLHAGPPITWDRMCGPTRGAIMGALIYEGMAG
jgi:hypothetical protein